jgi:hypothetical protein
VGCGRGPNRGPVLFTVYSSPYFVFPFKKSKNMYKLLKSIENEIKRRKI